MNNYPSLFTSLFVLLATVVSGWIINAVFKKVFKRMVGKTKTTLDDELVAILRRPVFLSVLLGGIYAAIIALDLSADIATFLGKLLLTVGLIIWGVAILQIARALFAQLHHRAEPTHAGMLDDLIPFLENAAKVLVVGVIFLTILSLWGINITPALASAGVVGVAVAFAARDTVANLFGGISVFLDKPYKTGDYVIIDNKYRGEVIQIGMRSTKIKTRDNILLTVPNSVMITNSVVNETGFDPKLRIRIPLGVAYGTNLEKAEKVLVAVTKEHKKILGKPAPTVRYRKFGDFSIELELMAVIAKPADRGRIVHQLIKMIDKRLRAENIVTPLPQYDVHLYQEKQKNR